MRKRKVCSEEIDGDENHVQLTPLLDVVFVLLITFMLLAPMLNVDHVDLAQSGGFNKKNPESSKISMTLKADDTLLFQGKAVTLLELSSILRAEKARLPDQIPQLVADKNCHFGSYQDVKNLLEDCGFQQVDILLK